MERLHRIADDFEATIRILPESEGGRRTSPCNGIRWDFVYAADHAEASYYMIFPDFHAPDGTSFPPDVPLPIGVELPARMTVIVDEMREKVHRARIAVGTAFYCCEGPRRVASGRVTRVTGLFDARDQ